MTPPRPRRDAFFLNTGSDRRFCLVTHAAGPCRGAVLHVPPFAEEMNRSRRMTTLAAQAFAQQGWTVMQLDLHGCGDSEGDFVDASWESWQQDLDRAQAWLTHNLAPAVIGLWSLRAGSLLASSWLQTRQASLPWLAWQPVIQGQTYLTQFLRIRLGADLADSGLARGVLSSLRAKLQAGEPVSVGGYGLSAALAKGLESSRLVLHDRLQAPMSVMEVAAHPPPELTPATATWLARASEAGHRCEGLAVTGQKFWQSAETETAENLIPPSLEVLQTWLR